MAQGTVREWHEDLGWGVLDSPETPGGCWAHYSAIDTPGLAFGDGVEVSEFKTARVGDLVDFDWESVGQDGYDFRAVVIRRRR